MQKYQDGRHWELKMWQRVIDSWYNGKLFNLYRAGQKHRGGLIGSRIERRVRKRLLRIFTGAAVDDPFNMQIFEYLTLFGTVLRNPADLVGGVAKKTNVPALSAHPFPPASVRRPGRLCSPWRRR